MCVPMAWPAVTRSQHGRKSPDNSPRVREAIPESPDPGVLVTQLAEGGRKVHPHVNTHVSPRGYGYAGSIYPNKGAGSVTRKRCSVLESGPRRQRQVVNLLDVERDGPDAGKLRLLSYVDYGTVNQPVLIGIRKPGKRLKRFKASVGLIWL